MAKPHRVALAILLLANTAFAAAPDIPQRFEFRSDAAPIWISAASAVAADGHVLPGVLQPEMRDELHDRRRQDGARRNADLSTQEESSKGCDASFFGNVHAASDSYPARTFADLVEIASTRTVISGVVSASAVGLHNGKPYTVLQIETDALLEGGFVAYLLYPDGKLRVENMTVCNDDPAFAALPVVGDAVTFVTGSAIDTTGTLFVTDGSLIVYDHAGRTVLPPALELDARLRRIASARELAVVLREAREARRDVRQEVERQ
jgi:hypothetical protein